MKTHRLSVAQKKCLKLLTSWTWITRSDVDSRYFNADETSLSTNMVAHQRTVHSLVRLGFLHQTRGRRRLAYELVDPMATRLLLISLGEEDL